MIKSLGLLVISVFVVGCSADKDCTKIIKIPGLVVSTPTGTSIGPDRELEVACDYEIPPIVETKAVDGFAYEVLSFNHTNDIVKNTERLKFEVKMTNSNDFELVGEPIFTFELKDKTQFSASYSKNAVSTCSKISAKSSCVFSYDMESSLGGFAFNDIKFVSVKFIEIPE